MKVDCLVCGTKFYAKPNKIKAGFAKTCSRRCNGISKRTRQIVSCFLCKKKFERPVNKIKTQNYCSRVCKEKDQCIGGSLALPHYGDGRHFYRQRALRHYGKICLGCGFDKDERMLDVHHRDSDRAHNRIENLEVLCVWCHALKTRGVVVQW